MSDYKKGDRVRILVGAAKDREATVTKVLVDGEGDFYKMLVDGYDYYEMAYWADEIEPLKKGSVAMEKFKVGDKVRIKSNSAYNFPVQEGEIVRVAEGSVPFPYQVYVPSEAERFTFATDEIEAVTYEPERLSELEIESLMWPSYKGTIYEKVCKERGTIPEPGW